jgi:hypothetical protein
MANERTNAEASSAVLDIEKAEGPRSHINAASRPQESETANAAAGSDSGVQNDGADTTTLPFSKAKSIALVATVTGASFLNVSALEWHWCLSSERARANLLAHIVD